MLPFTGNEVTLFNTKGTLKVTGLNDKILRKQEKEERETQKRLADMDPLVRQIRQYKEDAAKMRENNQMSSIDTKMKSGGELTPEELEYLKKNAPDSYREYQEVKQEKEAYKKQLKSCKTKDDVENLKLNKMGEYMSATKSITNNPNIPKSQKLSMVEKILKKVMGIEEVHTKFIQSVQYQNLPTEEEVTEKVTEKALLNQKQQIREENKSDVSEGIDSRVSEGMDTKISETMDTKALDGMDVTNEKAEFAEVKRTLTDYLTANRPNGYALEYFELDKDKAEL